MITYTIHLKHYKNKFDEALETMKNINKPSIEDNRRIKALKNVLKVRPVSPLPGKVYTFIYNAKYKKKLPYYDRYPLVLVLSLNRKLKTFHGLNFHYLNSSMREQFVKYLMKRSYDTAKDRIITTSMIGKLVGLSRRMYKECIKQYRIENVLRLAFREIPPLVLNEINNINDNTFINRKVIEVHNISKKKIRYLG